MFVLHKVAKFHVDSQICTAKKVTVHENYNADSMVNDIALIEIGDCDKQFELSDAIEPICLPEKSQNFGSEAVYAMVSGWGTLSGKSIDI